MANKTLLNYKHRNKIEATNKVEMKDIEEQANKSKILESSVTEHVSVRIDNHIRNQLFALINLGQAEVLKDMIELILNSYLETLDEDTLKKFDSLVKIYEERDVIKYNSKKNSKDK